MCARGFYSRLVPQVAQPAATLGMGRKLYKHFIKLIAFEVIANILRPSSSASTTPSPPRYRPSQHHLLIHKVEEQDQDFNFLSWLEAIENEFIFFSSSLAFQAKWVSKIWLVGC